MFDDQMIVIAVESARAIFKAADLAYHPDLVVQDIRGFDSVLAVKYILAIEEAFDIMLIEKEVDDMQTMGKLVEIFRAKAGGHNIYQFPR